MVATTIRMPEELHQKLKEWAEEEHRSVNDLTVDLLDQAARRRAAEKFLEEASRLRADIRARRGVMPDSVQELRELREERSRRG